MFATSSIYFLVAIFGENIERTEAYGLQLVEGQQNGATEPGRNENQKKSVGEIHKESGESPEQHLQEEQAVGQNVNESKQLESKETEESFNQETSEIQRRTFELPLSVGAGVGYAAVGLWMILDKRNSKIPFIIAIIGSVVLLGIYSTSRTVGISSLGKEPIGLLDSIVAALQVAIVAISLYVLFGELYIKGMTVGK